MRCVLLLLLAVALVACSDERSFDDRYDEAASNIDERARNIDAELDPDNAAVGQ